MYGWISVEREWAMVNLGTVCKYRHVSNVPWTASSVGPLTIKDRQMQSDSLGSDKAEYLPQLEKIISRTGCRRENERHDFVSMYEYAPYPGHTRRWRKGAETCMQVSCQWTQELVTVRCISAYWKGSGHFGWYLHTQRDFLMGIWKITVFAKACRVSMCRDPSETAAQAVDLSAIFHISGIGRPAPAKFR